MNDTERPFRFFPPAASSLAPHVDTLYVFTVGVSVFFSTLVALLIIYFCIRYRRGRNHVPTHPTSHTGLELTFVFLLTALFLGMFAWSAQVYARLIIPPEAAEPIYVVGKQWMWKVQYTNGRRAINELTVPVGRTMELVMSSQDVIHSFFIPAFRIKYDVLPFRYTRIWFKATRVGSYHLFCAEYCGLDHSRMRGRVRVLPVEEYVRWLGEGPAGEAPIEHEGRALFESMACHSCHDPDRRVGPPLGRLFGERVLLADGSTVVADDDYLRRSILEPAAQIVAGYAAVMPSFAGRLEEEQVRALIEYVKQLQGAPDAEP